MGESRPDIAAGTSAKDGRGHVVVARKTGALFFGGPASPIAAICGMTADGAETQAPVKATTVLADRMAAALVHREPGWRLPRRSALARRYNVSVPEVDGAIGELIRGSLV